MIDSIVQSQVSVYLQDGGARAPKIVRMRQKGDLLKLDYSRRVSAPFTHTLLMVVVTIAATILTLGAVWSIRYCRREMEAGIAGRELRSIDRLSLRKLSAWSTRHSILKERLIPQKGERLETTAARVASLLERQKNAAGQIRLREQLEAAVEKSDALCQLRASCRTRAVAGTLNAPIAVQDGVISRLLRQVRSQTTPLEDLKSDLSQLEGEIAQLTSSSLSFERLFNIIY